MELNVLSFGLPMGHEFAIHNAPETNASQCYCSNNCYQGNCSDTCVPPPPPAAQ